MGDIGYIYKVYFKAYTEQKSENKEKFGVIRLKIRNKNNDGYRFYGEDGTTLTIKNKMMGGVYVKYNLEDETPNVVSSFMSDDEEIYQLISGEIPAKNEEEKESLEALKEGLKNVVEEAIVKMLEDVKKNLDKLAKEKERQEMIEENKVINIPHNTTEEIKA